MAGFRKAKAEQAAVKLGFYGLAGSGKTFTALLCAEGIAKHCGKKIAFVDTERGTDFYCQRVEDRKIHPEAFNFDAIYTKSITEILTEVKRLDFKEYGIVVIDSITHIWEAARLAYSGKETSIGTIPFHAWAKIKKPYKELLNYLLSSPMHLILCGRQGNEFEEDDETGELKKVGTKMKAEGETPYEPHILIHMEAVRNQKTGEAVITAFAEKDRTGILAGKTIQNPSFETLIRPMMSLLGDKQAQIKPDTETAADDAEKLTEQDAEKEKKSAELLKLWSAKISICENSEQLKAAGKLITPELKSQMTTNHVSELRQAYIEAETHLGK
jgi:hypothetical protein